MHNGHGDAGRVGVGEDLLQLLAKLGDGLRRLGRVVFLGLRGAHGRSKAKPECGKDGSYTPP